MRILALTESPPGDIEKQVNLLIPRVAAKPAYMIIMGWRTTMNKKAFTLIELLVVIAIIAIVVASKMGFFLQFSAIFAFKAL